jgi:hypothetical protein
MVVGLLEYLKKKTWVPFINEHSNTLNRSLSVVGATLTTLGIHLQWNHDLGTLTISGLTVATIGALAWGAIKNFAWQEMIYRGIIKNGNANQPVPPPAGGN